MRRWLWILTLIAIGAALVGYGFWPRPLVVQTALVEHGPVRVTIEEEGKTRVTDRYLVSAPVDAYAERIELDVGDEVQRGQTIVHLQPTRSEVLDPRRRAEAQAAVSRADAALRAAERRAQASAAETEYAQLELSRAERLFAQRMVSRERLDQARTQAERNREQQRSAEAEVDVARYALEAARTALAYAGEGAGADPAVRIPISAPVQGRVLKVLHESEGPVRVGTPLIELGDPRHLEIEVELLSQDAVRVREGTRVEIEGWGGAQQLAGVVRRVEPVAFTKVSALGVEEQRVLVIVGIESPYSQWRDLGDRYRVVTRFIVRESQRALRVPVSALRHGEDGWLVFAVRDGVARTRTIEVDAFGELHAAVASGLEPGEQVVLHPDTRLASGERVTAISR